MGHLFLGPRTHPQQAAVSNARSQRGKGLLNVEVYVEMRYVGESRGAEDAAGPPNRRKVYHRGRRRDGSRGALRRGRRLGSRRLCWPGGRRRSRNGHRGWGRSRAGSGRRKWHRGRRGSGSRGRCRGRGSACDQADQRRCQAYRYQRDLLHSASTYLLGYGCHLSLASRRHPNTFPQWPDADARENDDGDNDRGQEVAHGYPLAHEEHTPAVGPEDTGGQHDDECHQDPSHGKGLEPFCDKAPVHATDRQPSQGYAAGDSYQQPHGSVPDPVPNQPHRLIKGRRSRYHACPSLRNSIE